jgi:cytochrome P450
LFLRQALETLELRGYTVPKGSIFAISPYIVHHDPRFYLNPDKFDPGRWTEEFTEQLHKFAFIPFSNGPRVCIGERFAWCEGTLALAYFAQRWEFELVPYQDVKPGAMGTMRPAGEIEMIVRKRERGSAPVRQDSQDAPAATASGQCPFHHG